MPLHTLLIWGIAINKDVLHTQGYRLWFKGLPIFSPYRLLFISQLQRASSGIGATPRSHSACSRCNETAVEECY